MKTRHPFRNRLSGRILGYVLFCLIALLSFASHAGSGGVRMSVISSKHNLSVSGPGPIRATTETEICIFCHTPHRAGETPLWNRTLSAASYTPYSSSTVKAAIGQPTGSSRLCLSCHDGTIALGLLNSSPTLIEMQNGTTTMPPGPANFGTDLSGHHPISFTYDAALASKDGQLRDPGTLGQNVRLDHNQQMQCTSCHDPHDNEFGNFLVQNNFASSICVSCHVPPGWQTSSHATSPKTWNGAGVNPFPNTKETTVAANACESCHAPHAAGTPQRLLNFVNEEMNCYSCHAGTVAVANIQNEFVKPSVHPITLTTGVHDPAEDPINPPRHVECVDCHNPHASTASPGAPPNVSGALAGLVGVSSSGAIVQPLTREYELCFRCHGDSIARGQATIPRQFVQTNLRLAMFANNASYHPVTAQGKNPNVPSMLTPYTAGSIMSCTDCHNNDQGPGANLTGPRGPHGSSFSPIIERPMQFNDGTVESINTYALCYKCHNQTSILNDESFRGHALHVVGQQTSCTTCHDSHGVASNPALINFNTFYVTPSSNGRMEYVRTGVFTGNCSLTCHGKDHNALTYSPAQPLMIKAPAQPIPVRSMIRR